MPRSYKILGFLFVTLLGAYGCAKGPGTALTTENNTAASAKLQKVEEDYRAAIAARDQYRQKLATSEEQSAKLKKDLEQQLEQVKTEREALKVEVKTRTGERDALQTQYETFRKTLRDMLGTADTAVGKLNLPPPQVEVVGTTLGANRN